MLICKKQSIESTVRCFPISCLHLANAVRKYIFLSCAFFYVSICNCNFIYLAINELIIILHCYFIIWIFVAENNSGFGDEIVRLFYKYLSWLFGVLDYCVTGGAEAYVHAQMRSERVCFCLKIIYIIIRTVSLSVIAESSQTGINLIIFHFHIFLSLVHGFQRFFKPLSKLTLRQIFFS